VVAISFNTIEIAYTGSSATGFIPYQGLFTTQLSGPLPNGQPASIANILAYEAAGGTISSTWSATESPRFIGGDGRMTGGGSIFRADGQRVTHGFEIHCDVADVPNRLEINWGGDRFHLDTLLGASCFTDPSIDSGHPAAPFNTYIGIGTGSFDGVPGATAFWTFTDAGEPGKKDIATIIIKDNLGNVVLTATGNLDSGNQQAHVDNK